MIKLLWLAIRDIEDKRDRQHAKEAGKKANERTAPGRLVDGAVVRLETSPRRPHPRLPRTLRRPHLTNQPRATYTEDLTGSPSTVSAYNKRLRKAAGLMQHLISALAT